jgi:hypothetical protein
VGRSLTYLLGKKTKNPTTSLSFPRSEAARPLPFSQSDLDALDSAIASGTLSVEFDGRKITYQNTAALIAARTHVAAVVNRPVLDAAILHPPRVGRWGPEIDQKPESLPSTIW